jgi:demethylmenaquinone methyltransferase/2-methoxy-6-polyprenyl-1,4-benzoquinol methylase
MAQVESGERASVLEKTYIWMHRHFPHIVDCRPIDPVQSLIAAGFEILQHDRREIWTMPVAVVLGRKP